MASHERSGMLGAAIMACALATSACGGTSAGSSAPQPTASRPSSPAHLRIVSPHNGQIVHSRLVHVRLSLRNAHIVRPTSTNLDPHEGHIHLYVDGRIVSMNYKLSDTVRVGPGTHTLRAEFVANDHLPWDPRIVSQVAFQVKPR